MATGVPESQLPQMFVNHEIARSRKGKGGQIVVHSLDGIYKNAASRTASKFENELTEGRDDIIEKLDAAGNLNQSLERLRDTLVAEPRWSFARAVAESKADLAGAIDAYAKGAIALNKLATVVEMYKAMPSLLRDLMRHAIDQEIDCATCFGIGLVKTRPDATKLSLKCPSCRGTGKSLVSSEHKRFAMNKAIEMAQVLPERQPLVQVQQNTQVNNMGSQEGLLEKMSKTADEILYRRTAPVIEAEVVKNDSN
jgi:chorismate mutase